MISVEVIATVLLGLAILGAIGVSIRLWLERSGRIPPYTLIDVATTLRFKDKHAQKATLVSDITLRANYAGLREYWHKGIRTDGPIENILINGQPPDGLEKWLDEIAIGERFPQPLRKGDVVTMSVSFDLIDAFKGDREFYIHEVYSRTEKLRVRIEFHPERPYYSARIYMQHSGRKTLLSDKVLQKSEGGKILEFEQVSPSLGTRYYLEWEW